MWLSKADWDFASAELLAVKHSALVALGLGASQSKRQWPIERFRFISEALAAKEPETRFLVVGNGEDRKQAELLRSSLGERLHNFAGNCSVGESGALLAHCSLYIGNDSGPMHMAAACGVPVVEISCHPDNGAADHANSPDRYHPWGVPYRVARPAEFVGRCRSACQSADPHCITAVSVGQVLQAVEMLTENAAVRSLSGRDSGFAGS
jgi:ADP-heptose:LPS heptosyltransferase